MVENQEWKKIKLDYIIKIMHGRDQKNIVANDGMYPILGSGGKIGKTNSYLYDRPSVLIGRKGTIDRPVFMDSPFWTIDTMFYTKISDGAYPKFVFYLFCTIDWYAISESSGRPSLTSRNIENFEIKIPTSIEVQRKIADKLSNTDEIINKLEKLIEKKKNIKQGTMQVLLTGKKRLDGFSGEWKENQFREVIEEFSSGATPYRGKPENYRGQIRWITSGELNYNFITDTKEKISENARKNTNLKIHPKGTFLMAITGLEAETTRGRCAIIGNPSTTNQSCMALYPKKNLSLEFLFYYYRLKSDELAFKFCQGTKQQSYTARIVKTLPIKIPPTKDEQLEITKILFGMDSEIEELEKQKEKYIKLKQGMMQKLLTGEIRLK